MKKLRLSYNAPVVISFALASLLALILNWVTGGKSNSLLFSVYRAPLRDPLSWLRVFLHVLGHAGYAHFMGNMMLILVVGPPLEEKYGSRQVKMKAAMKNRVSTP